MRAADLQGFSSGPPNSSTGWISAPEHYSPIDVATTIRIEPGKDLPFSVPLNHVGPSWYFRLTFQFASRVYGPGANHKVLSISSGQMFRRVSGKHGSVMCGIESSRDGGEAAACRSWWVPGEW